MMESEAYTDRPGPYGEPDAQRPFGPGSPERPEDNPASPEETGTGAAPEEQGQDLREGGMGLGSPTQDAASGGPFQPMNHRHEPAPAPAGDAEATQRGSADRTYVRARILRRFETWLDEVLEGEEPIKGMAAEILEELQSDPAACESRVAETGCDLFALWSTVTAMTEETRLQGRAFKQLHDSLAPMQELVGSVGDVLQRYTASLEQQDQRLSETTRQAVLREVLGTLVDMRDRLVRGANTASSWLEHRPEPAPAPTPPKPCLARRLWRIVLPPRRPRVAPPPEETSPAGGGAALEAARSLLKGYNLAQEVLDEALARFGVRPVECVGKPFDPGTMKAVDIDSQSDADDGTVLEVYRPGYWWNETIYRPAEVKVARKWNGMME